MNLLLFDKPFERICLDKTDKRTEHLKDVLRVEVGSLVFIGFINDLRARARVVDLPADGSICLEVVGTEAAPPPLPLSLLVGLPRPHTAKRLLFEAASMGVNRLDFFEAENGEPAYARSGLWQGEAWRERLRLGAEQSFGTHLPEVAMYPDLQTALSAQDVAAARVALDNYEASDTLDKVLACDAAKAVLAFGPERGWSPNERETLCRNGWALAHLGPHVLRSETAATVAVGAAAAALGLWIAPSSTAL